MPQITPAQQPPVRCPLPHLKRISADEQAIAQDELNQYIAEQAQAIAPTTDPLTSRDRRIIGEIIEVDPESIRTLWIEGGITVWVQLLGGGRLPFDRDWFATRVAEVKATLPETPRERNERLSEELETACQKYGLTHGEIDWLSFSTTLYLNNSQLAIRNSQLNTVRNYDLQVEIEKLGLQSNQFNNIHNCELRIENCELIRLGFLGCNLQGQWYSRISQLGGSRAAVDIDAAIAQLGIRQPVAA